MKQIVAWQPLCVSSKTNNPLFCGLRPLTPARVEGLFFLYTMDQTRHFKGVFIPAEIWLAKELNWTEKILLVEIESLSSDKTGCFASNAYLAEFVNVSEKTIANTLTKLRKLGVIEVAYDGIKREMRIKRDKKNNLPLPENGKSHFLKTGSPTSRKREHIEVEDSTSVFSFLEKKKQKKTEKKQPEKSEDSSIKKTTSDPKNNQNKAQLKKEKSCAKKEKRVSPEVPADLEELRAKLTFPLTFTAKMEDALMDFLKYRKERKKPYSNMTSLKTLINTVSTWSEAELVEAVQQSIAAQWTGLFKPKPQPKTKKSTQEILQEASRQNFIECQQGLHSPIDFSEMPF